MSTINFQTHQTQHDVVNVFTLDDFFDSCPTSLLKNLFIKCKVQQITILIHSKKSIKSEIFTDGQMTVFLKPTRETTDASESIQIECQANDMIESTVRFEFKDVTAFRLCMIGYRLDFVNCRLTRLIR